MSGNKRKKMLPLDEQIPWMKVMTTKLVNIGMGPGHFSNEDNSEREFVEFFEEFLGLFQKNIMTKYRNSKKENKRTRLAMYLRDVIGKIKLLTYLLENESKKKMTNYFVRLFKMHLELVSKSSLSRRFGNDALVSDILRFAKNLFYEDIDAILDILIIAVIPQELKNSLLLTVLSENWYFSATCASFYKYLVVAKILKENFSSNKTTIERIDQILSSSVALMPRNFENYLKSKCSIPSINSSMDLIKIVKMIDSVGAYEESLQEYCNEFYNGPPDLADLLGIPSNSETGFIVDTNPDLPQFQEVNGATLEENNDNKDEIVMSLRGLFSNTISSDEQVETTGVNLQSKIIASPNANANIKIENTDSDSDLEILGESTYSQNSDNEEDESSAESYELSMPNYNSTDSDETLEDEDDQTNDKDDENETKDEDKVDESIDRVSDEDESAEESKEESAIEASGEIKTKQDTKNDVMEKFENKNEDSTLGVEENSQKDTQVSPNRIEKEKTEKVKQGTSEERVRYQLRSKKVTNTEIPKKKKVEKRKLDVVEDQDTASEAEAQQVSPNRIEKEETEKVKQGTSEEGVRYQLRSKKVTITEIPKKKKVEKRKLVVEEDQDTASEAEAQQVSPNRIEKEKTEMVKQGSSEERGRYQLRSKKVTITEIPKEKKVVKRKLENERNVTEAEKIISKTKTVAAADSKKSKSPKIKLNAKPKYQINIKSKAAPPKMNSTSKKSKNNK